jgi:hypothetical protein
MPCKIHVGHHARRRKSKREFSTEQASAKFILQGTALSRCCCIAERQQSPSPPRRRLGCRSAKFMLAITHGDEKANANSALNPIHTTKKLTRFSFFTRLISPVFMRAANATQSASVTPNLAASISSLSTSNSSLPNFTVGMEHADADVRRTLLRVPGKMRFNVTFCSACGGGEDN